MLNKWREASYAVSALNFKVISPTLPGNCCLTGEQNVGVSLIQCRVFPLRPLSCYPATWPPHQLTTLPSRYPATPPAGHPTNSTASHPATPPPGHPNNSPPSHPGTPLPRHLATPPTHHPPIPLPHYPAPKSRIYIFLPRGIERWNH